MTAARVYQDLRRELSALRFGAPVACVYDPLEYAWAPFAQYLERYGRPPKETLLLGMNPGPFGMVQTGVPFGEVAAVRDWLGIDAPIGRPAREHPKRPVLGWACPRSEISGARLWGWARARYGTPEKFFARFFIANYCPLAFMEASGRNLTPDKLPAAEREPLEAACDKALRRFVAELKPARVVGVGRFARLRAEKALADLDIPVGEMLHPSPASPKANSGWVKHAEEDLRRQGVAS